MNNWRRLPSGRITSADLIKSPGEGPAALVAGSFFESSGGVNATATGSLAATTLAAPTATASASAQASGTLAGASLTAPTATATGTGSAVDVRVSWLQFDTAATPVAVRVSWLQFDTAATPVDVKVSWLQFDTAAAPARELELLTFMRRRSRR